MSRHFSIEIALHRQDSKAHHNESPHTIAESGLKTRRWEANNSLKSVLSICKTSLGDVELGHAIFLVQG